MGVNMSYAEDFEDVGGYYAEMDFYAEECEDNCIICEYQYECPNSDLLLKKRRKP